MVIVSDVTLRELIEIYTPTQEELALANQYTKKGATKKGFLVLLGEKLARLLSAIAISNDPKFYL
jgi:hypothetical protein